MSRILSPSQQSIGPSSPIDAPVIFLDVDGVLNTNATSRAHHEVIECDAEQSRRVDAALVRRLVDVVRVTRARIVLSSAWRLRFDSKPGLVAAFVFNIIFVWNEFLFNFQLGGRNTSTIPVALFTSLYDGGATNWPYVASLGTAYVLPLVVLIFFFQKYLLVGMTFGTVRGEV